jgi:hypothetical protein
VDAETQSPLRTAANHRRSIAGFRLIGASLQPQCRLAAENLFLRKQLALYLERQVKPRRVKAATRLTMVLFSKLFVWREVLTVIKPETLIRWHRQGVQLFWRWKPRGRPRVPSELQKLIAEMADGSPTWGEERIAAELLLKLAIRISPRTVRRYMPPNRGPHRGVASQRSNSFIEALPGWMEFVFSCQLQLSKCKFASHSFRDRNVRRNFRFSRIKVL